MKTKIINNPANQAIILTLLLGSSTLTHASLGFGGSDLATPGTTIYYEGNQKGGVGTASNQPWKNNMGAGGNISFAISGNDTSGNALTMTNTGGVGAAAGFGNNASNFALEAATTTFCIEIDYIGWAIDNNGSWYNADGTVNAGGSEINFTMGLIQADGTSLLWNADSGIKITLEAFGIDDITAVDHATNTQNTNTIPNGASDNNDFTRSYGAGDSSVILESTIDGGGDGFSAHHVGHKWSKQPGADTPGSGANFLEVGKAKITFEFVDFNTGDGVDSFAAGTIFGFSLDGGDFVPVPEPSSTALIGVASLALIIRRRR